MTTLSFKPATRTKIKLRLALVGPSGSGKTYTALTLARELGARVALVDTEGSSASKYAAVDQPTINTFKFDVLELESFAPQTYTAAIKAAAEAGYEVLIIDSLSHAWMGKDGAVSQVDQAVARSRDKNSFTAWRLITPVHNELVDTILRTPMHVIATMRVKTEYVMEKQNRDGRDIMVPRKIGLQPIQRDGIEHEFDLVADLDTENTLVVSKSRCSELSGAVIHKPGVPMAKTLRAWLDAGEPAPIKVPSLTPAASTVAAPAEPTPAAPTDTTKLSDAHRSAFTRNIAALRSKDGSLYEQACNELGYKDEDFATVETTGDAKDMWSKMVAKVNELREGK